MLWDERHHFFPGLKNRYAYISRFFEASSHAGNHYHITRNEFYRAITGQFTIVLENVETKEVGVDRTH